MSEDTLSQVVQKIKADNTYSSGGHPHTFVELYDGRVVQMLQDEPNVTTFREDYYYNARDNNLYVKKSEWVNINRQFDEEDEQYVYYNGRSVLKMVNEPDPKTFGDRYYYSLKSNRVFAKAIKWAKCTNL